MDTILITGDVTIDRYYYVSGHKEKDENWKQFKSQNTVITLGGAFQLIDIVEKLVDKTKYNVTGPGCSSNSRNSSGGIIYSNSSLDEYPSPIKGSKEKFWRISNYLGYSKNINDRSMKVNYPKVQTSGIVVIDDANNGFRNYSKQVENIKKCINDDTMIIYKYGSPVSGSNKNALWDVISNHISTQPEEKEKKVIVIMNADDLRRTECVRISKSLSWERTAVETVFSFCREENLKQFENVPVIIILFGMEGAIIIENKNPKKKAVLIFDNNNLEGQFSNSFPGHVSGKSSLLTASMLEHITKNGLENLNDGVISGLLRIRTFQEVGYKPDIKKCKINYPDEIFSTINNKSFYTADIPIPTNLNNADESYWQILYQKKQNSYLLASREIFKKGVENVLKDVPVIKFGNQIASDRKEIEQLSAIRELICEYLANPKPERPLSFAVFGAPGAGKSFAVKQIVKSIGDQDLEAITFNLSQFSDYPDLIKAFHKVRNITLRGKIPFVFFDEFDSNKLKWLKDFLAPMQDSEFREGETIHPIGDRAIFIFAGGTNTSFREFSQTERCGDCSFKDLKGPDFVSRLRGFIDIMGVDRIPQKDNDDDLFILRRAKLLYIMLKNEPTAKDLFTNEGVNIDEGVLRALLHISKFKHGVRSITAIYDISRLSGKLVFSRDCLPSREQLNMHVDADEFIFLVERERYSSIMPEVKYKLGIESAIEFDNIITEKVLTFINSEYDRNREFKKQKNTNGKAEKTAVDYAKLLTKDELKEQFKESNKDVAVDIPKKLLSLNISLRPQKNLSPWVWYTSNEAEALARKEHDRWLNERKIKGWYFAEKTNRSITEHEDMKPFDQLSPIEKEKDYEQIYAYLMLPDVIDEIFKEGFLDIQAPFITELYRLEDIKTDAEKLNELTVNLFDKYKTFKFITPFISQENNAEDDVVKKKIFLEIKKLAFTILSSRELKFRSEFEKQSLYNIWLCQQVRNKKLFVLSDKLNARDVDTINHFVSKYEEGNTDLCYINEILKNFANLVSKEIIINSILE